MSKLYLTLSSENNPDFNETGKLIKPFKVVVSTFEEASSRTRQFIEENDLGGGNFTGGDVVDVSGKKLGYISYNGRIWLD